jgi:carboxyl-terminal processing protease
MNRKFAAKLTVLVGAVFVALVLTFVRPTPTGLGAFAVGPAEARPAPGAPAATATKANYDLTKLAVVNNTLVRIRDGYVDPTRIDPKEMLYAALDGVQRNVAEVLIEPHREKDEVLVTVNDKSQSFTLNDVDSPWKLSAKLKSVFRFIQTNMNSNTNAVEVEYAAVNGMLGTLDPHSNLMDPEDAREMDISTQGKFGGIGITIGMRKNKKSGKDTLTVLNLISPEAPAAKAGLKAGDYIVKINDEPTENLTLNEAMGRLRGDPQTKVVVTVERTGNDQALVVPITRDQIHVSSVSGRLLKSNVGYLKIDQFAYETSRDLRAKVNELKKQGAKAWVLDLRGNPGGLLDQAIRVSDLFLESGTIVTTVGKAGKEREEKRAQAADTEPGPLAVLVNGGSASASEIVSGALKNLNRAVIIGQTTFGKGSVQVLYDNEDGSKLKLTIAQYLTPGDVSIQGVGITPDVELLPARIPDGPVKSEKDFIRLIYHNYTKESDLDAHLTSKNAHLGDKPSDSMKFLYEPIKKDVPDDPATAGAPDDEPDPLDKFVEDWEIRFARDYVAQATTNKRLDMIKEGKKFVAAKRVEEEGHIAAALGKVGVDWTVAKNAGASKPKLAATFTTDKPTGVTAGDVVAITGTVTNSGDGTAYQVHAAADTDDWGFDGTELAFGKIAPGETRTAVAYVKVDKDAVARMDTLAWKFTEASGAAIDVSPLKVTVNGVPHPQFAYTYQLIDDNGNGDGQLQLGESFRLLVTVKNVGTGASEHSTASLRNASGDGVGMNKVRFELDKLAPNDQKTLEFTFDVKKDFKEKELVIEMIVYDAEMREGVTEKLHFDVASPAAGPEAASGLVKLKKDTPVMASSKDGAEIIGTAKKGATFRVRAKEASWVKLEVEPGRPGFVPAAATQSASGQASANGFVQAWQVTPPALAVTQPSLETTGDRYHLKGTAKDDVKVEDVFVIVSNRQSKIDGRKVFYKSNRGAKDLRKMDFDADIPVWAGNNQITLVVRENEDVKTIQTLYVNRTDGQKTASAPAAAPAK